MRRIDRFRAMSAEELADILVDTNTVQCDNCIIYGFCHDNNYCNAEYSCKDVVIKWLNRDSNPMPKLEVGDVLTINHSQTNQRSMYVYLGDDTVWVIADSRYCFLSPEMKGNIVGIIRKGKGRYNFDTMDFWNSMEV